MIVDPTAPGCAAGGPCIHPIFGPTAASQYWSGTTALSNTPNAWYVFFKGGDLAQASKGSEFFAPAVRSIDD